jgi:hypothetical protein
MRNARCGTFVTGLGGLFGILQLLHAHLSDEAVDAGLIKLSPAALLAQYREQTRAAEMTCVLDWDKEYRKNPLYNLGQNPRPQSDCGD